MKGRLLLLLLWLQASQAAEELRGVWIAWAGNNIPKKERIADMMDQLAAHNLNVVFVDVWRAGYPYFISEVYRKHTGQSTDPQLDKGRDVLQDMVAEAHRVGLDVEAWFEYGFVASQGKNDLLFQQHPSWFARRRDGSTLFNDDYQFRWFSHLHPEAQQFLIALAQEAVVNYDVDGVEMDRIRYPEVNCGYDSATQAIYAGEHQGKRPPADVWNNEWMTWRAEKLTWFTKIFYDSIKAVAPHVAVSNAPIVYPYGFSNFCQDWRPWINNGYL